MSPRFACVARGCMRPSHGSHVVCLRHLAVQVLVYVAVVSSALGILLWLLVGK